jgi:hypothetical protein
MSTKQVVYYPPSERAEFRKGIENGAAFTVLLFAAAHKLLHDTARKQLERETKQGLYKKFKLDGKVFYSKVVFK